MSESELHKRFKERGWDIIVSIDYCNSIADGTHNTPKPVPEGFPLFTSKNLTASNTLDKTDYYNISEKDLVDINRRSYVNKYDIIFGMIGTIGNPVVITEKNLNFAVKNVGIFRFGGDYYKSSWFYYSLFSDFVKNQFAKALDGSTQNFVSLNMLRSFKLQVPKDKKVIKKICDILSSVDNLIEKTETLIAKYQSIKQGMMHDLFTRGVDANGQLRPPVDEAPELYKESELGWIPKGWDITLLEKCTSFLITYGIVQAGPHIERGIPYIRTGDMAGDHLLRETMLCTSNSIANSYKRSEVRTGEIVCAIRATVGKVLLIPPELNGANLTQGTARISPKDNINNIFLLWLLRSHLIQKEFQLSIKGTTFSEITLENLRKIRLCLPKNEKEQDFIANSLNSNERMIEREKRYLSKLLNIKTALMQDLLTGKVRVKPDKPEDTKS